jgi:hypothetical protein
MAVALSADGNTLAVGAHMEGAVYVFARSAGIWVQQAYIQASNAEAGDSFGAAVALERERESSAHRDYPQKRTKRRPARFEFRAVYVSPGTRTWLQQPISRFEHRHADVRCRPVSGDGNTLAVSGVRVQRSHRRYPGVAERRVAGGRMLLRRDTFTRNVAGRSRPLSRPEHRDVRHSAMVAVQRRQYAGGARDSASASPAA